MRIKIHGGTPANDDTSLCTTCRHSRITRGRRLDEELVRASDLRDEEFSRYMSDLRNHQEP